MDVYDFDKTLYRGDSTLDFFAFCLRRHPKALLSMPLAALWALAHLLGLCTVTRFKERFYRFLRHVPDIDEELGLFWEEAHTRIFGPCRPQPGDLVISASPEFLLAPVCSERGLRLIASKVSPKTGLYEGANCRGEEKLRRFKEEYPDVAINAFFSDSLSDGPLASHATKAFRVIGGGITPWQE
jgi:phosphoserine phosphatase